MSSISLASVALSGVNTKKGEIKRDGEYYYLCVGALNVFNSMGGFYEAAPSLPAFDPNSAFVRKIVGGNIYGEDRHPIMEPWMTEEDFYRRNEMVDEDRRCLFVRSLDVVPTERICNGLPVYELWAWIKPFGDKAAQFKAALDDEHQNVCISIRAWCLEKTVGGVKYYAVDVPLFFDWVQEPGIPLANKFYAEYDHKVTNQNLPRHMKLETMAQPSVHHPLTDRIIANLYNKQQASMREGERYLATESYLASVVEKYRSNAAGLTRREGGILDNPFGG